MNANTTWGRTETGMIFHSFDADGVAICRKNIKAAGEFLTETKVDEMLAKAWGISAQGYRKCDGCETREAAHRDRLAASLAPSTGEGDYLSPAAAETAAETPVKDEVPATRYSGNEYIHNLSMGDMFRFPGEPDVIYGPVTDVTSDHSLTWTDVSFAKGVEPITRHSFRRVEVTKPGPRCECGLPYDRCYEGCDWPYDVEKLWRSSF